MDKPRAELEQTEWLPFEAAVRAGVGSVMTAHIVYPALDPHAPATLSPAALTGLLRNDWGYGGVIVTDATDMRAIADAHPHGEAAPLALAAGADAVLSCGHGDMEIHAQHAEALERALSAGTLSEARVREALARLDAAAKKFPGRPRPYSAAQRAKDEARVQTWARQALEWVGQPPKLDAAQPVLLFVPRSAAVGGPYGDFLGGEELAAALRPVFPQLWVALTGDDPAPALRCWPAFPTRRCCWRPPDGGPCRRCNSNWREQYAGDTPCIWRSGIRSMWRRWASLPSSPTASGPPTCGHWRKRSPAKPPLLYSFRPFHSGSRIFSSSRWSGQQ